MENNQFSRLTHAFIDFAMSEHFAQRVGVKHLSFLAKLSWLMFIYMIGKDNYRYLLVVLGGSIFYKNIQIASGR